MDELEPVKYLPASEQFTSADGWRIVFVDLKNRGDGTFSSADGTVIADEDKLRIVDPPTNN